VHEPADRIVDLAQRSQLAAADAALGGEARAGALEHASQLDGVADVGAGELAHDVTASGKAAQEALVLELRQRQAQRRARHPEAFDERELGHARAVSKFAVEDELAQPQQRARDLGVIFRPGHRHVSKVRSRMAFPVTSGCCLRPGQSKPPRGLHARYAFRERCERLVCTVLWSSCMQGPAQLVCPRPWRW
jgi:hypothetical protein